MTVTVSRVCTTVTTKWLKDKISQGAANATSKQIRVLDTSFKKDKDIDTYSDFYLKDHIPQSVFFGLHNCVDSTKEIPRNLPRPGCFTEYVRSLGVWPDTHVIAYDRFGPSSAFRTWWLFRLFGHRRVSVLDGGYKKWVADGYELTDEEPSPQRSNFVARYDLSLVRDYQQMIDNMTSQKEQLIDARGESESTVIHETDGGRIHGVKVIDFDHLFNEDGTFVDDGEIQRLFDEAGVQMNSDMVASCNSGLTACAVAAAAHKLGKDIPVYYGSWTEWRQRAPDDLKQRRGAK